MAVKSAYGAAAQEICELFADYLRGDGGRPALAIGGGAPSPSVVNAIEKSLEAFGYGPDACTFASLVPLDTEAEGGDIALDAQALYLLVEGLDPLHVVAVDERAASALGQAYRCSFAVDSSIRVFGRQSVAFKSLDELLETTEGKQKAWRILKSLKA